MSESDKLLRQGMAEILGVSPRDLTDDATLFSYGVDSLHLVEMVMALEEELDKPINDDEADQYFRPDVTVGELIGFAKSLIGVNKNE